MSAGYKTQLSVYFNRKKRLKEKKRSVCTAGLTGDKVKDYTCQAETCRSIDGWMKWKVFIGGHLSASNPPFNRIKCSSKCGAGHHHQP